MGGGVFIDFKSSNGIEISWLVQVLFNFYWFQGLPMGGGRWVDEGEGGYVGVSYACMHVHTHMHMHVKHDKHGCLHVGSNLQYLYMYTCACVHACAHVWGHPPCPKHPPPTCPTPRAKENSPVKGWGDLTNKSKCQKNQPSINQNWIISIRSRLIKFLVISHNPHIYTAIHPTTHTPTHSWGCLYKT